MKAASRQLARGLLLGCAAAVLTASCGDGGDGGGSSPGLYLGSIAPDGATIFFAGPLELIVQPTSP